MQQVLVDKDPKGQECSVVWDCANKTIANMRVKELKAQGYQGVRAWDTQNNALGRLFLLGRR